MGVPPLSDELALWTPPSEPAPCICMRVGGIRGGVGLLSRSEDGMPGAVWLVVSGWRLRPPALDPRERLGRGDLAGEGFMCGELLFLPIAPAGEVSFDGVRLRLRLLERLLLLLLARLLPLELAGLRLMLRGWCRLDCRLLSNHFLRARRRRGQSARTSAERKYGRCGAAWHRT